MELDYLLNGLSGANSADNDGSVLFLLLHGWPLCYVSASEDTREYLIWKAKTSKTMFRPPPPRPYESSPKLAVTPCTIYKGNLIQRYMGSACPTWMEGANQWQSPKILAHPGC
jgi:hypothetical protein